MVKWMVCGMLILSMVTLTWAQKKKLGRPINTTEHEVGPALSGDGKSMLLMSTYSKSGELSIKYTQMSSPGKWDQPEDIPALGLHQDLFFIGGYSLSYDGKMLLFTSRKGPNIGGYDIWYCQKQGNGWSVAKNFGKPLNSKMHDACPSLSPDGKSLYFMRCKTMKNGQAEDCQLYVSVKKGKNSWHEAVPLHQSINQYHSTAPTILADNKTLLFSSNRPGSLGELDLYMSINDGEKWNEPIALDYLNTVGMDQFVSVPIRGDIIYYSQDAGGQQDIFMAKIPQNMRPDPVYLMEGTVTDPNNEPIPAYVQLYDPSTNNRLQVLKTEPDGSFFMVLHGSNVYDFSVLAVDPAFHYAERLLYSDSLTDAQKEQLTITLSPQQDHPTFELPNIQFEPYSSELDDVSSVAIKRLYKWLEKNPNLRVEISAHLDSVQSDSLPSHPELTEHVIDSLYQTYYDTINLVGMDSILVDSLQQLEPYTVLNDTTGLWEREELVIKHTYHNDRTPAQADAIRNKLLKMAKDPNLENRIRAVGYADRKKIEGVGRKRVEVKVL